VDDNATIRLLLTLLLEKAQYCVVPAEHGAAALAYLRASPALPDLIVLDLEMPVMNGWAFRQEQRRDPRLQLIPVVVCSAELEDMRIAAIAADAYVRKPFDVATFLAAVTSVLER
jgi:CheY-like chemotaxis protein